MTEQTIHAILSHGDRIELIPLKGGVKVMRVKREEVKVPKCVGCKFWSRCISLTHPEKPASCPCAGEK